MGSLQSLLFGLGSQTLSKWAPHPIFEGSRPGSPENKKLNSQSSFSSLTPPNKTKFLYGCPSAVDQEGTPGLGEHQECGQLSADSGVQLQGGVE